MAFSLRLHCTPVSMVKQKTAEVDWYRLFSQVVSPLYGWPELSWKHTKSLRTAGELRYSSNVVMAFTTLSGLNFLIVQDYLNWWGLCAKSVVTLTVWWKSGHTTLIMGGVFPWQVLGVWVRVFH